MCEYKYSFITIFRESFFSPICVSVKLTPYYSPSVECKKTFIPHIESLKMKFFPHNFFSRKVGTTESIWKRIEKVTHWYYVKYILCLCFVQGKARFYHRTRRLYCVPVSSVCVLCVSIFYTKFITKVNSNQVAAVLFGIWKALEILVRIFNGITKQHAWCDREWVWCVCVLDETAYKHPLPTPFSIHTLNGLLDTRWKLWKIICDLKDEFPVDREIF